MRLRIRDVVVLDAYYGMVDGTGARHERGPRILPLPKGASQ